MKIFPLLLTWLALAFLSVTYSGCIWHNYLPLSVENTISNRYPQKSYWLKQSFFTGSFYDDDRFRLADSHSFESLEYLQTPDNDIILPPPSDEIIAANTIVTIEKIEWPQGFQLITRPLFTPRYHPWVYFKLHQTASPIQLKEDKTHILVVPKSIRNEHEFSQWFAQLFSHADQNSWLSTVPPASRRGIQEKNPVIGMDLQSLEAALGTPDSVRTIDADPGNQYTKELAIFNKLAITLENGLVSEIDTHSERKRNIKN